MTPEEKRMAIAEACGWTWKDKMWERRFGNGGIDRRDDLPDYLNDLNAMHEAEQLLWSKDWTLRDVFVDKLARILDPALGYYKQDGVDLLDATAAQRADAFGKTLNLWTE